MELGVGDAFLLFDMMVLLLLLRCLFVWIKEGNIAWHLRSYSRPSLFDAIFVSSRVKPRRWTTRPGWHGCGKCVDCVSQRQHGKDM
jgi:hypothetical protein